MSPFSLLAIFIRAQMVLLLPALLVLWLVRRKFGGWDLKDWVVAIAVGATIGVDFAATADLEAHYVEYVGKKDSGTIVRKWMVEGEDSTTFKVAVQFRGYEDDYSVNEGYWDSLTPPVATPVFYDPDYPTDFVPEFRRAMAWPAPVVGGLLAAAVVLELAVFGWVGMRMIERMRRAAK
ncbi:MAG: hypothetical protein R3B13_39125 [Polyangiaceae bacterium]